MNDYCKNLVRKNFLPVQTEQNDLILFILDSFILYIFIHDEKGFLCKDFPITDENKGPNDVVN